MYLGRAWPPSRRLVWGDSRRGLGRRGRVDYGEGHLFQAVAGLGGAGPRSRTKSRTRASRTPPRSSDGSSCSTTSPRREPRGWSWRWSWPRRCVCPGLLPGPDEPGNLIVDQNRLEEGRILLEGALGRALAERSAHGCGSRRRRPGGRPRVRRPLPRGCQGHRPGARARPAGQRPSFRGGFMYGPHSRLVLLGESGRGARLCRGVRDETGFLLSQAPPSRCRSSGARAGRPAHGSRPTGHRRGLAGIGGPAGAARLWLSRGPRSSAARRPREAPRRSRLCARARSRNWDRLHQREALFSWRCSRPAFAEPETEAEVERRLEMIEGLDRVSARCCSRPKLIGSGSKLTATEAGFRAAARSWRGSRHRSGSRSHSERGRRRGGRSAPSWSTEGAEVFAQLEADTVARALRRAGPAQGRTASVLGVEPWNVTSPSSGAAQGGYTAAIRAAQLGAKAVCIEKGAGARRHLPARRLHPDEGVGADRRWALKEAEETFVQARRRRRPARLDLAPRTSGRPAGRQADDQRRR